MRQAESFQTMPSRRFNRKKWLFGASGILFLLAILLLLGRELLIIKHSASVGMYFFSSDSCGQTKSPLNTSFLRSGEVIFVTFGSPADLAGIRPGHQVLSINGVPLTDSTRLSEMSLAVSVNQPVNFRIKADGRERDVTILLRSPLQFSAIALSLVSSFVLAMAFLLIGFFVFFKRPADPRAVLFFLFADMIAAMHLLYPVLLALHPAQLGILTDELYQPGYLVVVVVWATMFYLAFSLFLHLNLLFPNPLPLVVRRPLLIRWIYLGPLVLCGQIVISFGARSLIQTESWGWPKWTVGVVLIGLAGWAIWRFAVAIRRAGWRPALVNRPYFNAVAYILIWTALVAIIAGVFSDAGQNGEIVKILVIFGILIPFIAASILVLVLFPTLSCLALLRKYKLAGPEEKRQIGWPLWGINVWLIGFVVTGLIRNVLPFIFGQLGPVTLVGLEITTKFFYILIPVSFAIGILKYHLMDIDIIIRKTLIYAIVTGAVLLVFLGLAGGAGGLLVKFAGVQNVWGVITAAVVSSALLVPLRNRVQQLVDRHFFRSRYDYPEALKMLFRTTGEASDREELLQALADTLLSTLRCRSVVIFLRSEHEQAYRPMRAIGVTEGVLRRCVIAENHPLVTQVDLRGIATRNELAETPPEELRRCGAEAAVAVRSAGKLTGIVFVGKKYPGIELDEDDREFLKQAAELFADALQRQQVRLQAQDLETARDIQRRLLPTEIPKLPGVALAAAWQPSQAVGGDYYDVVLCSDGKLGLVIADVSGKGMAAALLMSNMQAAFRALAPNISQPELLCERLNRVISGQLGPGRFITFFYARFDPVIGQLAYTNAGHCAPLLLRADKSRTLLEEGGGIIGIFPNADFHQGEVTLQPGEQLILYTDGISEARDLAGREFGEDRLAELFTTHREENLDEAVRTVVAEVMEHCSGEPQDDLTLMVLRRTELA